jgi:hypothetical protein
MGKGNRRKSSWTAWQMAPSRVAGSLRNPNPKFSGQPDPREAPDARAAASTAGSKTSSGDLV